mgnify:CR=1 FL=1|jgi:hypothetical protein
MSTGSPNIFHFATSELSQDAFLCWLLSWSQSKFSAATPELWEAGTAFIHAIYAACQQTPPEAIEAIEVRRQEMNIDIVAVVNERDVIAVEDKAHIREHSDQLARYLDGLREKYPGQRVLPVYVQTGDQSSYTGVKEAGFAPLLRPKLIEVLAGTDRSPVPDSTCRQFLQHLHEVEQAVQAFRYAAPAVWDSAAWRGFFAALQDELGGGEWTCVPNRSGGFMGFYWHWFAPHDECEPYLQLEEKTLCFKIAVPSQERRAAHKFAWHERIVEAGRQFGLPVGRPTRLRNGHWMTVAVWQHDYRAVDSEGRLDWPGTLATLMKAEAVLDKSVEEIRQSRTSPCT